MDVERRTPPCRLFTATFFCTSTFFFFTVYAVSVQCPFLTVRIVSFCNAGRKEETGGGRGSTVRKGTMANRRRRTKDRGLRNLVNGAVNLAGRPIISLLPAFLHARHFFGATSRIRNLLHVEQRAPSCNRGPCPGTLLVSNISHVRLFRRKYLG